jgi:hypothetical protein
MFAEYEDKVEPRLKSALVPVVLGVVTPGGLGCLKLLIFFLM